MTQRVTDEFGGLSGDEMSKIVGVDPHRVNQAVCHSLDVVAIFAMKNSPALLRALSDRMRQPTFGMREILLRRKRLLEKFTPRPEPETTPAWKRKHDALTDRTTPAELSSKR